jgi:nucleolar protein 4
MRRPFAQGAARHWRRGPRSNVRPLPPPDSPPLSPQARKHLLVRTVALGNLSDATAPAALAAARAAGDAEAIDDPAPHCDAARAHLEADGCRGRVAFVRYPSVRDANAAVARLHGQPFLELGGAGGGAGGAKKKRKGADGGAAGGAGAGAGGDEGRLWARVVAGEGAHVKKWRIILRNLPFQVQASWLD